MGVEPVETRGGEREKEKLPGYSTCARSYEKWHVSIATTVSASVYNRKNDSSRATPVYFNALCNPSFTDNPNIRRYITWTPDRDIKQNINKQNAVLTTHDSPWCRGTILVWELTWKTNAVDVMIKTHGLILSNFNCCYVGNTPANTTYACGWEIVGYRRGWNEVFRLLGYVAWGGLKSTFRNYLSVPSPGAKAYLELWILNRYSPETSVSEHLTPHDNPEDGRFFFLWLI
jgi:hypothetical protein